MIPHGIDLDRAAAHVRYVGSPEHKSTPSFAGSPKPRSDASICDPRFKTMQTELTHWLQEAFKRGAVGGLREGDFPRYAWYKDDDVVYEARLVNQGTGEYKGYTLEEAEWPIGVEDLYEQSAT